MSKRKTPAKGVLTGPKAKRQKISHRGSNQKNDNYIAQSRIFNDKINDNNNNNNNTNDKTAIINTHYYYNNNINSSNNSHNNSHISASIINIHKHSLNNTCNSQSMSDINNESISELSHKIGQRVKIYWIEDKQWYSGTIKDYKLLTNESLILYDDNENEWLNLENETVEYLYNKNQNKNKNQNNKPKSLLLTSSNNNNNNNNNNSDQIKIGNKINSGKILHTFSGGCVANINLKIDNKTNSNLTAIAFDNTFIQNLLNRNIINNNPFDFTLNNNNNIHFSNSTNILKLLHLCQYDQIQNINHNNLLNNGYHSNNNDNERRKRNNDNDNDIDIEPWKLIGCNSDNDPINVSCNISHYNLMHTNKYNRLINNSNMIRSNRKNNILTGNNIKKCNTKSIIDLKAIYPLQKIRQQNYKNQRKIIVIGAGIAGLACARELINYGYNVTVLEARNRAGGRIITDRSMGIDNNHGSDLGGGWIHGVERNPLTRLVERLKLTLHSTSGTIQMYDYRGNKVNENLDNKVEKEFNIMLDKISKENEERYSRIHGINNNKSKNKKNNNTNNNNMSFGDKLNEYLARNKKKMSIFESNLFSWHFSNLEYSNAADLTNLSLTDWDQDDEYAFNGDHCLIQEGYGKIIDGLKENINIKYNNIVKKINYSNDKILIYSKKNNDNINNDQLSSSSSPQTPSTGYGSSFNSQQTTSSSIITNDSLIINNSINIDDNNRVYSKQNQNINNITHIDICKKNKNDNVDNIETETVPLYAMISNNNNSQFVKLKDIRGMAHYSDNNNNNMDTKNGYLNENDKDKSVDDDDVSMSITADDEYMIDTADGVVITLPLGILKSSDVSFIPSLPSWKLHAIKSMGFGLLNKVFLKFSHVFWDLESDYIGYASSNHGEYYLFVNLVPVSGNPILMSLISGSFAKKIEKKNDKDIINDVMKILRKIFENKNNKNKNQKNKILKPIDWYITRWGKDKYSKGSYSYIHTESSGKHYDKLSYSVKDKLFFAGEATIRKWPASVHGAYLSGIREARKILNLHYIHKSDTYVNNNNNNLAKNTRRKRKKYLLQQSKLPSMVIKAGLKQLPIDSIFKPIKDMQLRISKRVNIKNKYSTKNNQIKLQKKQNKTKNNNNSIKSRLRRKHKDEIDEESDDNNHEQDISSMSSASNDDEEDEDDDELICSLCSGTGYLSSSNDNQNQNNKNKNKLFINGYSQRLIGPFIDNDNYNINNNTNNNQYYIHYQCALWSPDISSSKKNNLSNSNNDNLSNNNNNNNNSSSNSIEWYNVISCIKRSNLIKCCYCGLYGASVSCHNKYCLSSYHPICASTTQSWDFDRPDEGYLFFCKIHRKNILSLNIKCHKTKLLKESFNKKNVLRQPRPPKYHF